MHRYLVWPTALGGPRLRGLRRLVARAVRLPIVVPAEPPTTTPGPRSRPPPGLPPVTARMLASLDAGSPRGRRRNRCKPSRTPCSAAPRTRRRRLDVAGGAVAMAEARPAAPDRGTDRRAVRGRLAGAGACGLIAYGSCGGEQVARAAPAHPVERIREVAPDSRPCASDTATWRCTVERQSPTARCAGGRLEAREELSAVVGVVGVERVSSASAKYAARRARSCSAAGGRPSCSNPALPSPSLQTCDPASTVLRLPPEAPRRRAGRSLDELRQFERILCREQDAVARTWSVAASASAGRSTVDRFDRDDEHGRVMPEPEPDQAASGVGTERSRGRARRGSPPGAGARPLPPRATSRARSRTS